MQVILMHTLCQLPHLNNNYNMMIYDLYRENIVTIIEMHNYCTSYLSNSFASVGLCAHVLDLVQLFIMFMQYLMGAKYISVI